MENKEFVKRLYTAAKLQLALNEAQKAIREEFVGCEDWEIEDILYGCYEKDGCLYDKSGEMLSKDSSNGEVSDKYFVNQSCGYCEDDYFGTMFYPVDNKGTVVKVSYSC